jgi:hypothetical protein
MKVWFLLSLCVIYPPAPITFDELIKLIPPRGATNRCRFIAAGRPFELQIGRNQLNIVFLSFQVPNDKANFWPCIRTVESLTSQRSIWSHWQKFLEDPDGYLTWKYIGKAPF